MNPYDAGHNLARSIRQSPEYIAFKEAKEQLKSEPSAREMLLDFRQQQFKLQKQLLAGLEIAPEQQEKIEKLYQVISLNLFVKHYIDAEHRLSILMRDVHKIIAEAVELLYDPELLEGYSETEVDSGDFTE